VQRSSSGRLYQQGVQQRQADADFLASLQQQPTLQTIKLSTIAAAQNILITGPKDSGKTTVARTILTQRHADQNIVIDPHGSQGKWPCTMVVEGLDFDAADTALQAMHRGMRGRFKELAQGVRREGEFPRRTFIVDEFLAITQELDGRGTTTDAGKLMIARITQGRKVEECLIVMAQNDTTAALGIKGNADLKACFDYLIFLAGNIETRARFHGCPDDVRAAAFKSERPAVVWHPERNNWYVLLFDLKPVLAGQVTSVSSSAPTGTAVPVRNECAENAGTGLSYQYGTGTVPPDKAEDQLDHDIKFLHSAGVSWNKIGELLKLRGQKQERNNRIRRALGMTQVADDTDAPLVDAA